METKDQDKSHPAVGKIDDKLFWDIYGRPDNAVGFLRNFLPPDIVNTLDLDFVSVDKKSYLSEKYREHYTDLVVKTRFKGEAEEPVFVYFLLEHKSYIPVRPAFQLLRYMVEQWYDLEKKDPWAASCRPSSRFLCTMEKKPGHREFTSMTL